MRPGNYGQLWARVAAMWAVVILLDVMAWGGFAIRAGTAWGNVFWVAVGVGCAQFVEFVACALRLRSKGSHL